MSCQHLKAKSAKPFFLEGLTRFENNFAQMFDGDLQYNTFLYSTIFDRFLRWDLGYLAFLLKAIYKNNIKNKYFVSNFK